jgi:hypothetical protein
MKPLIFRRARLRSGFKFASMQIPEKNAEISSHSDLTSIFGFSDATFARSSSLTLALPLRLFQRRKSRLC